MRASRRPRPPRPGPFAATAGLWATLLAPTAIAAQAPSTDPPIPSLPADAAWHPGTPVAGNPWVNRALLVGALLALDLEARDAVRGWRSDFGDDLSRWAERPGAWKTMLPLAAGGSLLFGWLADGEPGLARGLAVVAGTVAGSAANETINQVVGRGRPSWHAGAFDFRPFRGHSSFPSGHAGFAFALAGSIDAVTESTAAAAVSYGVAGMVGLSRLYDDKHWLSDVVVAALLSGGVARRVASGVAGALTGGGAGAPPGPESEAADAGRGPGPVLVPLPSGLALRFEF